MYCVFLLCEGVGPKMACKRRRIAEWPPRQGQDDPKMAQDGPRSAQNGPKVATRWSKMGLGRHKVAPKWPKMGPGRPKVANCRACLYVPVLRIGGTGCRASPIVRQKLDNIPHSSGQTENLGSMSLVSDRTAMWAGLPPWTVKRKN